MNLIRKPNIELYPGIRVDKDTVLEYKNEHCEQTLKDLVLHSVTKVKGDNFESVYDTTIHLQEGDILISVGDTRIYSAEDLSTAISGCDVGDTIRVVIFRSGRQYSADIVLHESKG